jgi:diacylglycerol kinase (ATP)
MMAGIGADGAVMHRVSRSLKERIGPVAVGVAGLQALPDIRPVGCEILMDGLSWHGDLTQVVVGNTRQYGGFTQTTPNAYADDGLLDVCIFTASDFREAGRQALSLILRRRPAATSAEIYRAPYVLIRAQSTLPLQVDGSPVHVHADAREYTLSVVPDALSVLVPRTYGGEIFRRSLHKAGKKHR